MTTRWNPDGMWQGETVAVIVPSAGVTEEVALTVKKYKTIVANRAVLIAPWADMFVALDPHYSFWENADKVGFSGIRVCGVESDDYDAMYAGPFYERAGALEIRNNGLAALRIAFRSGAKRIVLVGLGADPEEYDKGTAWSGFSGLADGLKQLLAEISAAGIVIERVVPPVKKPTAKTVLRDTNIDLTKFPQVKKPVA